MGKSQKFAKRTIENTLRYHTPRPNWTFDQSWDWPWEKFGYADADVLFTDLHVEYNSIRCAIQDPQAWHLDVCEIAHHADTKKEFLEKLAERRQKRYEELEDVWDTICALLVGEPDRWENREVPDHYDMWERMVSVSRNFSFDTFVDFFGLWAQDGGDSRSDAGPAVEPTRQLARTAAENRESSLLDIINGELEREASNEAYRHASLNKSAIVNALQTTRQKSRPKSKPKATGRERSRSNSQVAKEQTPPRTTGRTTTKPNGITKQQPRRRKAETSNPTGLRRSARIQEQAMKKQK